MKEAMREISKDLWDAYQRLIRREGGYHDGMMAGRPGLLKDLEALEKIGLALHHNGTWTALRPSYQP